MRKFVCECVRAFANVARDLQGFNSRFLGKRQIVMTIVVVVIFVVLVVVVVIVVVVIVIDVVVWVNPFVLINVCLGR